MRGGFAMRAAANPSRRCGIGCEFSREGLIIVVGPIHVLIPHPGSRSVRAEIRGRPIPSSFALGHMSFTDSRLHHALPARRITIARRAECLHVGPEAGEPIQAFLRCVDRDERPLHRADQRFQVRSRAVAADMRRSSRPPPVEKRGPSRPVACPSRFGARSRWGAPST